MVAVFNQAPFSIEYDLKKFEIDGIVYLLGTSKIHQTILKWELDRIRTRFDINCSITVATIF